MRKMNKSREQGENTSNCNWRRYSYGRGSRHSLPCCHHDPNAAAVLLCTERKQYELVPGVQDVQTTAETWALLVLNVKSSSIWNLGSLGKARPDYKVWGNTSLFIYSWICHHWKIERIELGQWSHSPALSSPFNNRSEWISFGKKSAQHVSLASAKLK